jgi:hypothetical protein
MLKILYTYIILKQTLKVSSLQITSDLLLDGSNTTNGKTETANLFSLLKALLIYTYLTVHSLSIFLLLMTLSEPFSTWVLVLISLFIN